MDEAQKSPPDEAHSPPDAAPARPAAPAVESPAPEATIPAPPFAIPPVPVPGRPVHTEADVREVYDDLVAAGYSIGADPDPARVKDVWAEMCLCYQLFHDSVAESAALGRRAISPVPEILSFDVVSMTEASFHVNATRRGLGGKTYDAYGHIVHSAGPAAPEDFHVIAAILDGAWKFTAVAQGHL